MNAKPVRMSKHSRGRLAYKYECPNVTHTIAGIFVGIKHKISKNWSPRSSVGIKTSQN